VTGVVGPALAAAAVLVAAAAGGPVTVIDRGIQSRMDQAKQVVVHTEDEWEQLWREHAGARPRPPVDFSQEMVLAVFLGTRPTAGWGVEIASVAREGQTTVARYRETRPAPGTMAAQVVTSPYAIVAVPKTEGPVRFEQVEGS
jgi:hypothetical protein